MEVKLLEIRDIGTTVSALAILLTPEKGNDQEKWLLGRVGFTPVVPCVGFLPLTRNKWHYDPYEWGDRTFQTAHGHIRNNWNSIKSGDVIDVEFILGESDKPKTSERLISEDF